MLNWCHASKVACLLQRPCHCSCDAVTNRVLCFHFFMSLSQIQQTLEHFVLLLLLFRVTMFCSACVQSMNASPTVVWIEVRALWVWVKCWKCRCDLSHAFTPVFSNSAFIQVTYCSLPWTNYIMPCWKRENRELMGVSFILDINQSNGHFKFLTHTWC